MESEQNKRGIDNWWHIASDRT